MTMLERIKRNSMSFAKCVGIGIATLGMTAVEIAASIEIMNKIVDGCDEDNPANFGQTLGVCVTTLVASGVEMGTLMSGATLIENEIDNWD